MATKQPSHATGTREEWLAARFDLLDAEKELTRRSDDAMSSMWLPMPPKVACQ